MTKRFMRHIMLVFVGLALFAAPALAEQKADNKLVMSDKVIAQLMKFAFSLMPQVYTGPDGKKINIDKKNPNEVIIPVADARRIVDVGVLSARAQNCDLKVMQTLNHNAMVKYETIFKNWTTKQKLFINQLHLFTVLYFTGNAKFTEGDAPTPKEKPKEVKRTCTDEQKKAIQVNIDDYLNKVKTAIQEELKRRSKLGSNEKKNKEMMRAQN